MTTDSEAAVLGAVLEDAGALAKVLGTGLEARDFSGEGDALVWTIASRLARQGGAADAVTVRAELERSGLLERVGGSARIASLLDAMPDVANVEHYARLVRLDAARRRLATAARAAAEAPQDVSALASLRERLVALEALGSGKAADAAEWRTLAAIAADPAALEPPPVVAAGFAWSGRVTLFAGAPKAGKSTTARHVAASVSAGRQFLSHPSLAGTVLVANLEEHTADAARGLIEARADADKIVLADRLPEGVADLRRAAERYHPAFVVIDSLAAFAAGRIADPSSSAQWTPLMLELTALARDSGAALLLIHHATKSTGTYRDSSAIGANVDCILEMTPDERDATARKIRARARWPIEDFTIRYIDGRLDLAAAGLSIDAQVWAAITATPGLSKRGVRQAVPGRAEVVDAAVRALVDQGMVEDRGSAKAAAYYPRTEMQRGHTRTRSGHGRSVPLKPLRDKGGHGRDTLRTRGACPTPLRGGRWDTVRPRRARPPRGRRCDPLGDPRRALPAGASRCWLRAII